MNDHGCIHLTNFKAADGVHLYELLYSVFVAKSSVLVRREQSAASLKCHSCYRVGNQLHSCLHCIYFGCYANGHIQEHAKDKKHFLALDLEYGNVLCFLCGDYVYDRQLLSIATADPKARLVCSNQGIYMPWEDVVMEGQLLLEHKFRRRMTVNSSLGMRGLLNLGNTCFMNSIMQVLTHTPLLRDYFLADQHRCQLEGQTGCLGCEVSRLFQEFYSGEKIPLSLHRLLHLIWTHMRHLAGYEQQDAHEFFIAALDVLHRHCEGGGGAAAAAAGGGRDDAADPKDCNCIIDQIFTGDLQSDVVCQACKGVSTTIDPFWDISLDLGAAPPVPGGSAPADQPRPDQAVQPEPATLVDCLERFTRAEHLGPSAKIKCNNCQTYQESTKQLTMKKLPVVASFHLKRFEHSSRLHKKISTFIAFPEHLDMTPFLTDRRNVNNNLHGQQNIRTPIRASNNNYSLFAVVNHLGSLDAGHYTAFVRQQRDHWFKCDDSLIKRTNLQEVLQSEGYLLFYHKTLLEYD